MKIEQVVEQLSMFFIEDVEISIITKGREVSMSVIQDNKEIYYCTYHDIDMSRNNILEYFINESKR